MLHLQVFMQVLSPISGGMLEGQSNFFKAHHPSTEKPKALEGFEPRTEPELGTGDFHSTSTPPPPILLADYGI